MILELNYKKKVDLILEAPMSFDFVQNLLQIVFVKSTFQTKNIKKFELNIHHFESM